MKRFFLFFVFSIFSFSFFAAELSQSELKVLYSVLDYKYYAGDYEELDEKLNFLQQKKKEYDSDRNTLSDEAKLICDSIFVTEVEQAKKEEINKKDKDSKLKKQEKKAKEDEIQTVLMECYQKYLDFAETHSDLSSHFKYHFKETQFAVLAYFSTGEQLKILKGILDDYKAIEEQNPELSENLFMLGCVLYMMPKIAGGDKDAGKKKIQQALDFACCDYEKASATVMLSQIYYEEKMKDEAEKYLNLAIDIRPENKTVKLLKKANAAGYSMFELDKYLKKNK